MTGYATAAADSGPAVACIAPSVCAATAVAAVAAVAAISKSTTSKFACVADADADDDTTFSVITFIILYGFVPRNDLGKYWSSTEGAYSGIAAAATDAAGVVVLDVVSSAENGDS